MKKLILFLWVVTLSLPCFCQPVPAEDENIPYLVTFGKDAPKSWGDPDYIQIFFFVVPETHHTPIFLRVFDPNVGGKYDEGKLGFNSKTKFSIYGGMNAFSKKDDKLNRTKTTGYDNGTLLYSKTFGTESTHDGKWYSFGPINPTEGQLIPELGGRVFKVIAEGISGDDGNLYKYFLSVYPTSNVPVEGGNAFTFEYTFRLHDNAPSISHIYPFVDKQTVAVKQHNFDLDGSVYIRIISVSKKGLKVTGSNDNEWGISQHPVTESEKGKSLDVQFVKTGPMKNDNIAFYITNQYGKYLPFYTIPIGGVPKYNYKIGVRKK